MSLTTASLYGQYDHISHNSNRLMHTFVINATLLTRCHAYMFQPSKGHLQGVQLIHFRSKVNKMSYQIKIQRSELQVLC